MPNKEDIALMAHLMRRAGFGATRAELEELAERGYEATVDELLRPEDQPDIDEYELYRYLPMLEVPASLIHAQADWLYRMVHSGRPLQEKVALFWHHVFATGNDKVTKATEMGAQIELFRQQGMAGYRELLIELAKSPAMIYWLDNHDNHKRSPNENWGRELLELFSLGVGHYTEEDVFECARAFTGWTMTDKVLTPWGHVPWTFVFRAEDHDNGEKTFLGHTGNFNGEDIIDIILQQPACPQFIMRHLYNFFVADEPEVPKWPSEPPRDPEAIARLSEAWVAADFQMKPVLKLLFNSDFFKEARYQKVKNPAEVISETLKITGDLAEPDPSWVTVGSAPGSMGQDLLNPPSVEGWHTGREWINSGAMINRVNFVAERVGNTELPGVKDIVGRVTANSGSNGHRLDAEDLVDRCLDEMGPLEVTDQTRKELVEQVQSGGPVSWSAGEEQDLSKRVGEVLALIAGTREYQFG